MTPEELKEIEERYNSLVNNEAVKENLLREMCIAIVDTGKLLFSINQYALSPGLKMCVILPPP